MNPGTFILYRGHGALKRARAVAANSYSAVRCPHHTSSLPSILGQLQQHEEGGPMRLQPGELILAGSGFLILDDLPEFPWTVIEELGRHWRASELVLRSRWAVLRIPVHCAILATAARCPCSYLGEPESGRRCVCTDEQVRRFEIRVKKAAACFARLISIPAGDVVTELHAAYVPVYRDRFGCIALMRSGCAHDTFPTRDAAKEWLAAIVRENAPERLVEIWGAQALGTFGVRLVETWPSGDPKRTILDEDVNDPYEDPERDAHG